MSRILRNKDIKANYYALFIAITLNVTAKESLIKMGISPDSVPKGGEPYDEMQGICDWIRLYGISKRRVSLIWNGKCVLWIYGREVIEMLSGRLREKFCLNCCDKHCCRGLCKTFVDYMERKREKKHDWILWFLWYWNVWKWKLES